MISEDPVIARSFKKDLLAALPSLRAFAVSLTGRHHAADDLVQDTIMKAWAKQDHFEHGTNMKAWLFTILRNEFYSQMRKHGREVSDPDGIFIAAVSASPAVRLSRHAGFQARTRAVAERPA